MGESNDIKNMILTTNGIKGACAAAAMLISYPESQVKITSPRHLPSALEHFYIESHVQKVYIAGVGISPPYEDLFESLQSLACKADIYWYLGKGHEEIKDNLGELSSYANVYLYEELSDVQAIIKSLNIKGQEQNLLSRLADLEDNHEYLEEAQEKFCYDLILAANRRFFFYGDDSLNIKTIRFLAGLESISSEMQQEVKHYRSSRDFPFPMGSSNAMKDIRKQIGRLGPVPEPVLITGPSGAGKEVIAKALHVTSRRPGEFVTVNCALLGSNITMVEDRLFGHVKGAFTGATSNTNGAFEEANRGTLFLDEISELPIDVQAQLLRVLEDQKVRPLGTMKTRTVDVRIITATNKNLKSMVENRKFREDLFFRLNVLHIQVSPLRERPNDMKSIAYSIKEELEYKGYTLQFYDEDWQAIQSFDWPGNVRQLTNVLKRSAYLGKSIAQIIEQEKYAWEEESAGPCSECPHLKEYFPTEPQDVQPIQEVYQSYILQTVKLFHGNISQASKALKIAPNTVRKYLTEK